MNKKKAQLVHKGARVRVADPTLSGADRWLNAQTGVVAGVSVDEYDRGLIRKHELTRPDKEEDRTRHMLALGVQPGPVFLTYITTREIDELSGVAAASEPEYDFTAPDGVRHTFWVVDDADRVAGLTEAFGRVPRLYKVFLMEDHFVDAVPGFLRRRLKVLRRRADRRQVLS